MGRGEGKAQPGKEGNAETDVYADNDSKGSTYTEGGGPEAL